jgi:hypothetical protein
VLRLEHQPVDERVAEYGVHACGRDHLRWFPESIEVSSDLDEHRLYDIAETIPADLEVLLGLALRFDMCIVGTALRSVILSNQIRDPVEPVGHIGESPSVLFGAQGLREPGRAPVRPIRSGLSYS